MHRVILVAYEKTSSNKRYICISQQTSIATINLVLSDDSLEISLCLSASVAENQA